MQARNFADFTCTLVVAGKHPKFPAMVQLSTRVRASRQWSCTYILFCRRHLAVGVAYCQWGGGRGECLPAPHHCWCASDAHQAHSENGAHHYFMKSKLWPFMDNLGRVQYIVNCNSSSNYIECLLLELMAHGKVTAFTEGSKIIQWCSENDKHLHIASKYYYSTYIHVVLDYFDGTCNDSRYWWQWLQCSYDPPYFVRIQLRSPHCHSTYQNIKEVVLRGRLVASEKVQHLTLTPFTEFLHPI